MPPPAAPMRYRLGGGPCVHTQAVAERARTRQVPPMSVGSTTTDAGEAAILAALRGDEEAEFSVLVER